MTLLHLSLSSKARILREGGASFPREFRMLVIGNIYGHGFGAEQAARLEQAGFTLRMPPSRYAGSQVCRFIDFEDGPALELIEVEDPKAYLDFVPNGMAPYAPGISLVVPDWAERDLAYFDRKHAMYDPYRLHVPYDGSDDPSKPGWNYLNFATPLVPGVFVWLTKLDEPPPRRPLVPRHPNGAIGVRGLVFDGDVTTLQHLARVAESDPEGGALTLEGVTLWPKTSLHDVPRIRGKAFPLLAVVLETTDLSLLPRELREDRATTFESRDAVHLETNDLAWDLLITEPDPERPARRFPTHAAQAPQYRRAGEVGRRA
ncbi:MAG TPA: hypothetical protein HA326_09600 [Thermoplasmata archaeon]|nr:hypothetical protein [Thermoplasmata archaeon]